MPWLPRSRWRSPGGFGAALDALDDNDHIWAPPPVNGLPTSDQVPWEPPVVDQGKLMTCCANAVAAAVQMAQRRQALPDFAPARLYINYYSGIRDRPELIGAASGVSLRDSVKAVNRYGVPPEPLWPYQARRLTREPSVVAQTSAMNNQVLHYQQIVDNDIAAMKASIVTDVPVVFTFLPSPAYTELKGRAKDPFVPKPAEQPREDERHANVILGYDDRREAFWVRNSWGKRFGDGGHCWLAYDYLADNMLADNFWRIEIVENPQQPVETEEYV